MIARLHLFPLILVASFALCIGCKHENIPTYPNMPIDRSLEILRQREESLKTLSGTATVTLYRNENAEHVESVRLDAAIAMQSPDQLRLRAWKFGQAVFDLTYTPQGVWLYSPDDPKHGEQMHAAGLTGASVAKGLTLLSGRLFAESDLQVEEKPDELIVRKDDLICHIQRLTLTPRLYRMVDRSSTPQFELKLDQYAQLGSMVFPRYLEASDFHGHAGRIEIELKDIELNGDLPPAEFTPPRRATKLP